MIALVCAAAVSSTLLFQPPSARSAPDPDGAEAALEADADGPLRIRREDGVATFVGARPGTDVDNPLVTRRSTVSAAARAHLRRYGAVIGADGPGSVLEETRRERSVAGTDVVRFRQEVDGLPVVGGEVVVSLGVERELASFNANLSTASDVPAATVSEAEARAAVLATMAKAGSAKAVVEAQGHWLFDPEAVGWPSGSGPRGVWRFEVRVGDAVRRMMLVDDRSGAVLLDVDLIQEIDRIVCDQANVKVNPPPCTSGAARTELSGTSPVADVNHAFDHAGVVSDFYDDIADVDLTAMIGLEVGGTPRLSSTVRVCRTGQTCPYANAYWDGDATFYGDGYAVDDVVGHEMTHGVIERTSGLLYWNQSGAINEALADIIGEIIDHRNATPGEDLDSWQFGEDVPGPAFRNVADPTLLGDPDRMTSPLWDTDPDYSDRGGVHTNSGVANKAFHLISQGGDFNGQTITGIDAGDDSLTASALLWVEVLQSLGSFTEYADLAEVLPVSCGLLVEQGLLSAADCTSVQQAITATEMKADPPGDPTVDPARTCPQGLAIVTLLDSEQGADQASLFTAGSGWGRIPATNVNDVYTDNAYSLGTSWVAEDPTFTATRSLTGASAIALPASQPAYLAFRHWYLTEFEGNDPTPAYYDGGTVEIDDVDDGAAPIDLAAAPWDNGPTRTLEVPNETRQAFAGSSRGWIGSRVDLSAYAGKDILPVFTMRSDALVGSVGWYLDDIEVYTCAPVLNPVSPTLGGGPGVGDLFEVESNGVWSPANLAFTYQWLRGDTPITDATSSSYRAVAADLGAVLSVRVRGAAGGASLTTVVLAEAPVRPGILSPSLATVQGTAGVGRTLTAIRGLWGPSGITFTYQWLRDGTAIKGATGKKRTLTRWDRGHRLQVRVTGSKPGYTTVIRTSPRTPRVR